MDDCCDTSACADYPKKAVCPVNGQSYHRIDRRTLLHHLCKPWRLDPPEQGYYFCDSPDCDVVYFGENKLTFNRDDLRIEVGQKSQTPDRPLCYCFDVRTSDLSENFDTARDFIVIQTKSATCDCEIRNPSGRCCLKDFPQQKND